MSKTDPEIKLCDDKHGAKKIIAEPSHFSLNEFDSFWPCAILLSWMTQVGEI